MFPRIPGFFIASAVYMIGEKAADVMLRDARAEPTIHGSTVLKESSMAYDVAQLFAMSQQQLDDLFKASPAGDIPERAGRGHGDHRAGHEVHRPDRVGHQHVRLAGQGLRCEKAGCLKNRVLMSGIQAIVAKVYKGPSWLDGKECIVLDYSETSLLAHYIRDEIRLIGPGFYLGKVYWGQDRLIDFCLQF